MKDNVRAIRNELAHSFDVALPKVSRIAFNFSFPNIPTFVHNSISSLRQRPVFPRPAVPMLYRAEPTSSIGGNSKQRVGRTVGMDVRRR